MKRWTVLLSVLCTIFLGISGALGAELAIVTPTDGQEDVPNTSCTLIWKVASGDEDISSLYTYDVYFGSSAGDLTTPVSQDLTVSRLHGVEFRVRHHLFLESRGLPTGRGYSRKQHLAVFHLGWRHSHL